MNYQPFLKDNFYISHGKFLYYSILYFDSNTFKYISTKFRQKCLETCKIQHRHRILPLKL